MLKSPLRYPGGKQKAIPQIAHYLPPKFKEFREPFFWRWFCIFSCFTEVPLYALLG